MPWLDDYLPRWFSFYETYEDLAKKASDIARREVTAGNSFDRGFNVDYVRTLPATFSNTSQLTSIIEAFDSFGEKIDTGGAFEKARLRLSEDKRFQFSFSLASKGLFRIPEYYSAELAAEHPNAFNSSGMAQSDPTMVAGVCDPQLVQSIELANSIRFFVVYSGKEYLLRQQQKGTAYILQNDPTAQLTSENSSMPYSTVNSFGGVTLGFASNTKKSYIEIPKQGGRGEAVDLYIPFDYIQTNTSERLLSAIPLLYANQFFNEARIKVRINIIRTIGVRLQTNQDKVSIFMSFTVKDFDENLNWDRIAQLRGDVNRATAMTTMNATVLAVEKDIYAERMGAKNFAVNNLFMVNNQAYEYLTYTRERDTTSEFGRYKNWMYQQTELGAISRKLVPKPLMMILSTEGLLGDGLTITNMTPAIEQRVKDRFFQVINAADLYYNKSINKVVSRIKKRFDEEGKTTYQLSEYLIQLAGKLYRDAYPRTGQYASSQEEIEEADRKYNQTLTKIGNIISTYQ